MKSITGSAVVFVDFAVIIASDKTANVASKLHTSQLHAVADAQERDPALAHVGDRPQLALDAARPEPGATTTPCAPRQDGRGLVLHQLGIDSPDLYRGIVKDPGVREGLVD